MITWPFTTLTPYEERWSLDGVALNGPTSASGLNRFAKTDGGGFWTCQQKFFFHRPAQIKAARAIEALLDGGATSIIIPAFERPFAPYPNGYSAHLVPHSDGTPFSDDTLYEGGLIDVTLAADAALRATTLQLSVTAVAPLEGGERFSIVHPVLGKRLYTVASVGEVSGGVQQIKCRPPLREAATAGTELDFDKPGCIMRLANARDFLSALNVARHMTCEAVWVESFDAS
ncbi:MAG: hypothetical protein ACK4FB_08185 [Brevundimonas sp.]|uniref:hypothetical protein n=1 Tax=Brevundimonas sp. TaxID=1871086 RepID=UPI00391A27A2